MHREAQEELLPQNLTLAALSRSDQVAALSRYLTRQLLRRFPYLTEQDTEDIALETIRKITEESAEFLHDAPHSLPVSRPNDVQAARQPVLSWSPKVGV